MEKIVILRDFPDNILSNLCDHVDNASTFNETSWIQERDIELSKFKASFTRNTIIFEREELYTMFLLRWS